MNIRQKVEYFGHVLVSTVTSFGYCCTVMFPDVLAQRWQYWHLEEGHWNNIPKGWAGEVMMVKAESNQDELHERMSSFIKKITADLFT